MTEIAALQGIIPDTLKVQSSKIMLDSLEVQTDIGFHDFEIGKPQKLLVTVELWLNELEPPADDNPQGAWDYDFLRNEVIRLAGARRYNLQETLVHAIYQRLSAMHGIKALRVSSAKPDIYGDARKVGIEIASFTGLNPH
ncbi:dihydroneopterin aldolase [Sphingomonas sp.]|uniref:dihydroneopterin aldolase n=1 Tax=Sphingomonas sp. TaxID=28214 RepID=UPI00286D5B4B|nr:dihydroneopterin aldolase [Sphingomonas sp.]